MKNEKEIAEIERMDAWSNIVTGLGVMGKDKSMSSRVDWRRLPQTLADEIYAADDIVKRFVNEVVDEGTREWIKFTHDDHSKIEPFTDVFETLKVRERFNEAWKSARTAGGSGTLIITDLPYDKWYLPLDPAREGQIRALVNFTKDELNGQLIENDLASPRFGHPRIYRLQPLSGQGISLVDVHYSRIMFFHGEPLPKRQFVQNNYWHDSVINSRYEAFRDYSLAHSYSNQAISDFSVTVMKMNNLANLVMAGNESKIMARISIINMVKSIGRLLLMDKDEDLQNVTRNVSGLDALVRAAEDRLVAATGYPRTKLFGESPGGLGSNGKSEDRSWYDYVSRQQELNLQPNLDYLLSVLEASPKGPTNGKSINMSYEFIQLWQLTEMEQTDIYAKTAAADNIYIQAMVLDPTIVTKKRFMAEKFNIDLQIEEEDVEEIDASAEEKEKQEAEAAALAAETARLAAEQKDQVTKKDPEEA